MLHQLNIMKVMPLVEAVKMTAVMMKQKSTVVAAGRGKEVMTMMMEEVMKMKRRKIGSESISQQRAESSEGIISTVAKSSSFAITVRGAEGSIP